MSTISQKPWRSSQLILNCSLSFCVCKIWKVSSCFKYYIFHTIELLQSSSNWTNFLFINSVDFPMTDLIFPTISSGTFGWASESTSSRDSLLLWTIMLSNSFMFCCKCSFAWASWTRNAFTRSSDSDCELWFEDSFGELSTTLSVIFSGMFCFVLGSFCESVSVFRSTSGSWKKQLTISSNYKPKTLSTYSKLLRIVVQGLSLCEVFVRYSDWCRFD